MSKVINLLDEYGVEYVTRGPNVKFGNVNVKCPFCGASDPSEHMGINLQSGVWGCWRNDRHRGAKFPFLFSKLTDLPLTMCQQLFGTHRNLTQDSLADLFASKFSSPAFVEERLVYMLPDGVARLDSKRRADAKFFSYLAARGFDTTDRFLDRYKVMGASCGLMGGRVVLPTYNVQGDLIGCSGRDITGSAARRYLVHPTGLSSQVYNADNATGGQLLVVVEGQFDVMKLDWFLHNAGVGSAVGVMTSNVNDESASILQEISMGFESCVIVFDNGAEGSTLRARQRLPGFGFRVFPGSDDFGAMSNAQIKKFVEPLL